MQSASGLGSLAQGSRSMRAGRPATHKLRMLSRVQDLLSTQKLHNELLDGGLLGALSPLSNLIIVCGPEKTACASTLLPSRSAQGVD